MRGIRNRLTGLLVLVLILSAPASASNSLNLSAGNGQSATVNTAVAIPPCIIVQDANGTPVTGIPVTFTVVAGGGTVTPSVVTTGTDGKATVSGWTLGTAAGSNTLTASAADAVTITITATGMAGPATQMIKTAGDHQNATAGTAVAVPPGVRVTDTYNNPVSGAVVIFSAIPYSAVIAGSTQTTDPGGNATVGSWTLATITGQNTLTAANGSLSVQFIAQGTGTTGAPAISGISPAKGSNADTLTGVIITGTNFSPGPGSVNLTRSGENNITGTCSGSTTSITCSFPLTGKTKGSWNVVVTGSNGLSGTLSGGFTIFSGSGSSETISSINPSSCRAGDSIGFQIAGSDFVSALKYRVYLYKSGHSNISADDVKVKSATRIDGTFDLDNDTDPDTYQLCLRNEFNAIVCRKNAFTITSNRRGSIDLSSSPSGAAIFLDGVANGTTPATLRDVFVGTHAIILRKNGCNEWGKTVTVNDGKMTSVDARLATTANTAAGQPATPAPAWSTKPVTSRPAIRSSLKIPTTYADVPTTEATSSPLDSLVVIGATGLALGFAVLRQK